MTGMALVFPGQGSQVVGMGRELADADPAARAVFESADEALGFELSKLCWEGPEEQLLLTENTQPAILTHSVAAWTHMRDSLPTPIVVAGHSLGEYSALVVAGCLDFSDAVRLVRERGRFMQEAVPVGEGAMAAVIGLDEDVLRDVAESAASEVSGVCDLANLNAPGQIVLAGSRATVERASEIAKDRGAKRALLLAVSAPFHSSLMASARTALEPLLDATEFRDPEVPVVCNVDAALVESGEAARAALVRQVDGAVQWIASVELMLERGAAGFVELGPGAVLGGLIKRIRKGTPVAAFGGPQDREKVATLMESLEATKT